MLSDQQRQQERLAGQWEAQQQAAASPTPEPTGEPTPEPEPAKAPEGFTIVTHETRKNPGDMVPSRHQPCPGFSVLVRRDHPDATDA